MRPQKSKRTREQQYVDNRWHGYYMEDLDCTFCMNHKGKKGCNLSQCAYEEEKLDAIKNGRIKRKHRIERWDL